MERIFLFVIPEISYHKSDLNIPQSPNRTIIGQLARMITNAIFLSHSLRDDITIRIFVQSPKPHFYQIKSETIRYLGPELRSSASILRKVEKVFTEKLSSGEVTEEWFEPNPGLFAKLHEDPFEDLVANFENTHLIYLKQHKEIMETQTSGRNDLLVIENTLKIISKERESLVFIFTLNTTGYESDLVTKLVSFENSATILPIDSNIPFPNLISIINIILDEIESEIGKV